MYVYKNFNLKGILSFSGGHLIYTTAWATAVTSLYAFAKWDWFVIPWLPLSVIGTAVAFYVGFKNNSAYDRLWEGRKIWGAIVNGSRSWGTNIKGYVGNQFLDKPQTENELSLRHKRMIYRHIAWLYTLRNQLLVPTSWEHVSLSGHVGKINQKRMVSWGKSMFDGEFIGEELSSFLSAKEIEHLSKKKNVATQIIDLQSQDLKKLREENLIDDFRHMELQKLLNDFYTFQGQAERIKKFPLPRQYGSVSLIFVGIFIFLLPLGMVSEFAKLGEFGIWISIPFTVLVGWVYIMMELVGDYSENPFEGLGNDIPMLSLCRTIEIDLREMLGETKLPNSIEPKNGILM